MRSLVALAVVALTLAGCDNKPLGDTIGPRPEEPTMAPFKGISELTPEARAFLSEIIPSNMGDMSVAKRRGWMTRSVLMPDGNGNGLSKADFYDAEMLMRAKSGVESMNLLFPFDWDNNAVVTEDELKRGIEAKSRNVMLELEQSGAHFRQPLYDPTSMAVKNFRLADTNGDKQVTLEEAYQSGIGDNSMKPNPLLAERVFVLDFNKDGLVTREELDAALTLYLKDMPEDPGLLEKPS